MQIPCEWTQLKSIVDDKQIPVQFVDLGSKYVVCAIDANLSVYCEISKVASPDNTSDQYDFETNYKASANANMQKNDSDGIPIWTTIAVDAAKRPEFRKIVTRPTWLYQPKSLDFWTAKYNSLYNRKHNGGGYYDGADPGDAWLKFYNSSNTELTKGESESAEDFQTRLTAGCTKTILYWETVKSFDVQGALLYFTPTPTNPAWLWCIAAPDLDESLGGSVPFMGRGMNLKMMAPLHPHIYDAVSASTIQYDPVYHSGRVAIVVKHGAGEQIGIQFVVVGYEEP